MVVGAVVWGKMVLKRNAQWAEVSVSSSYAEEKSENKPFFTFNIFTIVK